MHKLLRLMTTMEIACHQASYDPERADFVSDLAMYVPGYTKTLQAASTLRAASELLHAPLRRECGCPQTDFVHLSAGA